MKLLLCAVPNSFAFVVVAQIHRALMLTVAQHQRVVYNILKYKTQCLY